jgi:hypothetical protein
MSEDVLTAADLRRLQHTVGATQHRPKRDWGFRKHYASGDSGEAYESMRRMERLGFMRLGGVSESGMHFFHATEAGCREAGLDAKQIKRALED